MKILLPIAITFLLIISINGCYYDSQEFLYPQLNTSCDTTNVTFSGSVAPILSNYCLSCHSNNTAASFGNNIKLQDYADVKLRVDDGKLIGSIMHSSGYSPMPKGTAPLESCKLTIINKWVNAGAPNN